MKIKEKRKIERGKLRNIIHTRNSDKEKFRSNIGRKVRRPFRIVVKKYLRGWVGFRKSYVIFRVGHSKCLRLLTRWVGGVKKGKIYAYVIFE